MRFVSMLTATVLSTLAIASPLNTIDDNDTSELDTRATAKVCNKSHLETFNNAIPYGMPFCQFYYAIDRTRTPVPGLSVSETYNVCECILAGNFNPAIRVGEKRAKVSTVTVAMTTARSVPILTVGTVTEKVTERVTKVVTAKATNAKETIFRTITKESTVTKKILAKPSTVTIMRTTMKTAKPTGAAKTSTLTIARTTVTARGASASAGSKETVTIAKTTVTSTKSSTITIAVSTITVRNNIALTTMFRTVSLSGLSAGSGEKTVTRTSIKTVTASSSGAAASQSTVTVTAKASDAAQSTVTFSTTKFVTTASMKTVTETKTVVLAPPVTSSSGSSSSSSTPVASGSSAVPSSSTTNAATTAPASSASSSSGTSSTSTRSVCALAPTNTPPTSVTIADSDYERFYRGCGYTENPKNPGTQYFSMNFPTNTTTFPSSLSATDAVLKCANEAYYQYADPNQYLSFDLHFISTTGMGVAGEGGDGYWECVKFFSEQSDVDSSPYFNVPNSNVTVAYGYSSGLYSDAAAAAAGDNAKRDVTPSSGYHPKMRGLKLEDN